MPNAQRFKFTDVPRQQGELARLKVVQGPDRDAVYILLSDKVTIGRGETADVMISDLKTSRAHAELVRVNGAWQVRDLGSANGILHNGKQVREAKLTFGDAVTLGETTMEFMVSGEAGTMMLRAPARTSQELEAQRSQAEAQKARIHSLTKVGGLKELLSFGKAAGGAPDPNKRKKLLYAAVGIMALLLFMDDPAKKPRPRPKGAQQKQAESRDLASFLPQSDKSANSTSEMFFKSGFREYRERNWLRAKTYFETVLQVEPDHFLAKLYLDNCQNEIATEVKYHLEVGKQNFEVGKLRDARGHFEAVLRLLFQDQSSAEYVEAKEQLATVNKAITGSAEGAPPSGGGDVPAPAPAPAAPAGGESGEGGGG